ncbi:MAG: flavodoxin domain-containing protein [bacterium]
MKVLVLFDSVFGNTKKIAEAVADGFKEVKVSCLLLHAGEVKPEDIAAADLIVIGSPTRAFHATEAVVKALRNPHLPFNGKRFAAYDTRIDPADIASKFFRKIVSSFGYADDQISRLLKKRGASELLPAMGFFVTSSEGPLKKKETENAFLWSKQLFEKLTAN